jgi:hypothetical protein
MKNVHILPTDKPSRLIIYNSKLELVNYPVITPSKNQQNINITSDEKFVRGEWITDGIEVIKATPKLVDAQGLVDRRDWRKIILTTDPDLIAQGVQAIDDEFLEWFVKNPSCESVDVETYVKKSGVETDANGYREMDVFVNDYKIIIPQEEPKQDLEEEMFDLEQELDIPSHLRWHNSKPKQETLEEFIFKVPFDYNIKPKEVIDMCMKEQENIILTFRLGNFIDMINSLSDDTEKNRILKSVFNNRDGELLLESYKSMKLHYEK